MHGVRAQRGGGFRVGLAEHERELLRQLCIRLADEVAGGGPEAPGDDGLARLFPAAYADDEEAAAEYERLVGPALADGKVAALRLTAETAGGERLDEETLQAWLGALNDVRLVLGTRLGVTEDVYAQEPSHPAFAVYAWLTWLQGEVVEALSQLR